MPDNQRPKLCLPKPTRMLVYAGWMTVCHVPHLHCLFDDAPLRCYVIDESRHPPDDEPMEAPVREPPRPTLSFVTGSWLV
jgi:hypothetical protein